MSVIKITKLTKTYHETAVPVHAVNGINLEFEKGEFAAIVGPSGSGKTTLLNMIGGLEPPTSGSVEIHGMDISELSSRKLIDFRLKNIGFVFQAYNLIPVMTAYENAEFVLNLQGVSEAESRERVMSTLKAVGLEGLEHRRPDEMSGGQQQRVAIARAIVTSPAIVLADEPTANVDSHTAESLLDLMQQLNREQGITFLFSTHDQHVIDRARRIITIHDGKIESDEIQT